jgi:murein DD-endopeptidase MepM/ murein hydrolase activator NlpD
MIRVFPVAAEGAPHYTDDFSYVRPGATKPHGGIDIFASAGTAVFAVDDGELEHVPNPLGGNAFKLTTADGTFYYGAHLAQYEGAPRSVLAGDVIGYVGNTGNAASTSPHLHFEVHPSGGVAVDAFPQLQGLEPQPAGDVHPAPPAPASPVADLPRLPVVPGLVPPIPHGAGNGRRGGAVALVLGLGLGLVVASSRRPARALR